MFCVKKKSLLSYKRVGQRDERSVCSDAVVEVQCCGERTVCFRKEPRELVSRFPAMFNALSRDHVRPWSSPVKAGQCAEDAPTARSLWP